MRTLLLLIFLILASQAIALPKYPDGALTLNNILLLQDHNNPNFYYYLPPYPRLSETPEGDFEFFCLKYAGTGGAAQNGGLFHALVTFSLRPGEVAELEKKLQEKFPKARIMGVVPMMETLKEGEKAGSGFKIVSSILGNGGFSNQVLTSGSAPFLPGSKAAIAARLTQDGATLLWESFQMGTSDVSVVVDGYFEAAVKGYNATVKADLEILYNHLSTFKNKQGGFKRELLRSVVDSMRQSGGISVDVFDNSVGTGIKTEDMQAIVDLITGKVIELMFDTKSGWAKMPDKTAAIEPEELAGRYKNGDFVAFFAGDGKQDYIPDDQYMLKEKREIRSFSFFLNLSKSTVIKVPVHTAGNIRGFYEQFKDDPKYFKVVNLEDAFFQKREVFFQLDGNITDCFSEVMNHASVILRKIDPNGDNTTTREIQFLREDAEQGKSLKSVEYPRSGDKTSNWLNYEYRISWSLKGVDTLVTIPADPGKWMSTNSQIIALSPPIGKRSIEIDIDRSAFREKGIKSCEIRFSSFLLGNAQLPKTVIIRDSDNELTPRCTMYMDKDSPVAYQIVWNTVHGSQTESMKLLESDFLFVNLPRK